MHYIRYFIARHQAPLMILAVAAISLLAFALAARVPARPLPASPAHMQRLAASRPTPLSAPASATARLLARLPNDSGLPELLHAQAEAVGVALDEVSYQREEEQALPVWRLYATFTLQDSYAQIRRYVDQVLRASRNVALQSIDCTRDDIASEDVSCAIKLVAYARISADPMSDSPHGR